MITVVSADGGKNTSCIVEVPSPGAGSRFQINNVMSASGYPVIAVTMNYVPAKKTFIGLYDSAEATVERGFYMAQTEVTFL